MIDDPLLGTLEYLGCNPLQQKIYLHCLESGRVILQELATTLGAHRVTIHSAVEGLVKKGLLYETKVNKKRVIRAEGPDALERLFEVKKTEMSAAESQLRHAIDLVGLMKTPDDASRPSIKFYEGVIGFRKMLEETLESKNYLSLIVYVDTFSKIVDPEYFLNYFSRRAEKGIKTQAVYPPCAFAELVDSRRQEFNIDVRILPQRIVWSSGIFSWNEKTAFVSYSEERALTTTIIENSAISHLFQSIMFRCTFDSAKSVAESRASSPQDWLVARKEAS